MRRIRQRALLIAAVIFLVFVAVGIILWIGGHDVLAGRLSAGQLSAFVFYAVIVATSVGAVSEVSGRVAARGRRHRAPAGDTRHAAGDRGACGRRRALPEPATSARWPRGVTFAYPSRLSDPALSALYAQGRRGERVALVGPSGAGKTTVFQLLLRFYDPQSGRVLIDGVDVRAADPRAVRGRIAVVPQEPVIFAASVWDNVRYGRPDATDEEVRDAVRGRICDGVSGATAAGFRHRSSASAASSFREVSVSASPSRAPCWRSARSCCSTKRRVRSTPKASAWCSSHSTG